MILTFPDASYRSSKNSSDKLRVEAANGLFLAHWGLSGHRSVLFHSPEQTSYSVHLPSFPSTQIQVVSAAHQPLARASCGTEGFRNAKKGTGIAAQTAGIAAAAVSIYVCMCVLSGSLCAGLPFLHS